MTDIDIHTWFSLSYANYLVVPRSVLQSMPEEWQYRFVACLQEMHEQFGHLDWPAYDVRTLKRPAEVIAVYSECDTCDGAGDYIEADDDGYEVWRQECPDCEGTGEADAVEDYRYETPEEVGFRSDPIPHYNRGRTKLEPRPVDAA